MKAKERMLEFKVNKYRNNIERWEIVAVLRHIVIYVLKAKSFRTNPAKTAPFFIWGRLWCVA